GIDARDERTSLEMWQLGEELVSILRLSTRRLSEQQVTERQAVLERLVAYMRAAYDSSATPDSLIQRLRALGLPFDQIKGVAASISIAASTGGSAICGSAPGRISASGIRWRTGNCARS